MEAAKIFGKVLRELRIEANLTQEQLGLEADLRRTFISLLELGHQQPTLTTLIKLANTLNIPAHRIIQKFESVYLKKNLRFEINN